MTHFYQESSGLLNLLKKKRPGRVPENPDRYWHPLSCFMLSGDLNRMSLIYLDRFWWHSITNMCTVQA